MARPFSGIEGHSISLHRDHGSRDDRSPREKRWERFSDREGNHMAYTAATIGVPRSGGENTYRRRNTDSRYRALKSPPPLRDRGNFMAGLPERSSFSVGRT